MPATEFSDYDNLGVKLSLEMYLYQIDNRSDDRVEKVYSYVLKKLC